MQILKWTYRTLRAKGIVETSKIVTNFGTDLVFDWRYGTDTMRWVRRDDLAVDSDNLKHSQQYKATKSRPLHKLFNLLQLPRDCNFVDIGAGKGRVVLIAAQYGFSKAIGIEFSAPLCAIARSNITRFSEKRPQVASMEIVEADATAHRFDRDDRVFFMFNPFDQYIMTRVMDNLGRSFQEHPRKAWLIYNDPYHHQVIKKSELFQQDRKYLVGGTEFNVYIR